MSCLFLTLVFFNIVLKLFGHWRWRRSPLVPMSITMSAFGMKVMTHVVDALGPDKGPDLDRIALAMVDAATKVGSDEAVSFMASTFDPAVRAPTGSFQKRVHSPRRCRCCSRYHHIASSTRCSAGYLASAKYCVVDAGFTLRRVSSSSSQALSCVCTATRVREG